MNHVAHCRPGVQSPCEMENSDVSTAIVATPHNATEEDGWIVVRRKKKYERRQSQVAVKEEGEFWDEGPPVWVLPGPKLVLKCWCKCSNPKEHER